MKFKKFAMIFVLLALLFPLFSHAQKIGWITDIHAGNEEKNKKSDENVFYPKRYKQYFSRAVEELKAEGVKLLILSGDISDHTREMRYAKKIKAIAEKGGMETVWSTGNHDNESLVEKFMNTSRKYYYLDRKGWRIIVLDTEERPAAKEGGMHAAQKKWLDDLIQSTEIPVLVVMHRPIFNKNERFVCKSYRATEKLFSESEKVKMVLSGHWHDDYFTTHNSVKYMVGNPLTIKNKMGSYYIIDLDTLEVDARKARASK